MRLNSFPSYEHTSHDACESGPQLSESTTEHIVGYRPTKHR